MAEGSRGAQGRRAAPRRAGELRGAQKEPGGGEQMARSGKGTRRLAPGSFLDPLWEEGAEEGLWLEHRIVRSLLTTRKKKKESKNMCEPLASKKLGLALGAGPWVLSSSSGRAKGEGDPPSPPSAPAAAPNWARRMAGGQKRPSDVLEPARRTPGLLSPLWVEGVLLTRRPSPC